MSADIIYTLGRAQSMVAALPEGQHGYARLILSGADSNWKRKLVRLWPTQLVRCNFV